MSREEHIIDGYKALHSVRLNGVTEIVAEDPEADDTYRLYKLSNDNQIGISEYSIVYQGSDYLDAMQEFVRRLGAHLDTLDLDRIYRGSYLTDPPILAEDCVPDGMDEDMTGKVIAIRADALSPEFRSRSHQLNIATGGFGCFPDATGRAVYCTNIYSGEEARFNREDVLGVIAEDSAMMSDQAREKLAKLRKPPEKESVLAKTGESKKAPPQERRPKTNHKKGPER
jgi:hypothetical protein